jgi:hypothetical protein
MRSERDLAAREKWVKVQSFSRADRAFNCVILSEA